MSKDKEENAKPSKLRRFFTKKNILVLVLLVLLFDIYFQVRTVNEGFSFLKDKNSALINEIGEIKNSYIKVGNDLNQVRKFLGMQTSNYENFAESDEKDDEKNVLQLALFNYVNHLSSKRALSEQISKNEALLRGLSQSRSFLDFLRPLKLGLSPISGDDNGIYLKMLGPAQEDLIILFLSKEEGKLFFKTTKEKKEVKYVDLADFEKQVTEFLSTNKDNLLKHATELKIQKQKIEFTITSEEIQEFLLKAGVKLSTNYEEKDLKITYSVFNKSAELIGEIVLDTITLELSLIDKTNPGVIIKTKDITAALMPFLKTLNPKTLIEKKADMALAELKNTIEDPGFKMLLSQNKLKIAAEPRQDEKRVYYDIIDDKGKIVSSIVLEKPTGVINIVQPDGSNAQNVLSFDKTNDGEDKKKTLVIPKNIPDYGDEIVDSKKDLNILIVGSHGGLMDTMIFTNIDEEKGEIKMISIPRDLFYKGRKINAFAKLYGMEELKKSLSDLTGYKLDKYIHVDMYAFIDVIDLIGGIDVSLKSAVIDPTYRVEDHGKVSTLHYEPGDYHLGGKEVLRLARTRHTSSDFARAERQQMILKAIQSKAKNLGFGDAETIYEIAKTVLGKTETDIGLKDAIAYFFRYQNYKIVSNDVMSSGNIFYVPPYITEKDCQKLIEEAAASGKPKPDCEGENHAYSLLPLNNDWNIIKWFFREKFQ